ncbi:Protein of uncharacterised function (DUF3613) [Bordetella ansorpii]|uniref:Protein of uncharacterized function (DUF3613) n=1 Tax=Bordetella ansorpii TaxID=288768 RepID=A0A157SQK7_9BORD|nr:DUF3613 domain-containing protein [Bordetella ansorpii]SAI72443.1 Protein of uncharacterised function (DUF3613) [Bordetella ansorpii]
MHPPLRVSLLAAIGLLAAGGAAAQQQPVTGTAATPPVAQAQPVAPAGQTPAGRPVVRQVQEAAAPAAAAPAAASAAVAQAAPSATPAAQEAPREEQFGDITRGLVGLQAAGLRAGPGQPLQGPVATAAWNRYMKSFEHPIPQWFGERVSKSGGSGGLSQ